MRSTEGEGDVLFYFGEVAGADLWGVSLNCERRERTVIQLR